MTDFDGILEQRRMEMLHARRLDLDQFRTAIRAHAFETIRVEAAGVYFSIQGQIRAESRRKPKTRQEVEAAAEREMEECMTLCTSRKREPRRFRNPTAALQLLREIGATSVEVQMQSWYPERGKQYSEVKRPDMTERLTRAHEAARLEAIRRWEG